MKDPLDDRDDPYQRVNEEARRQKENIEISLASKPRAIKVAMAIEDGVKDRSGWDEVFDRLSQPAKRVRVDLFFYSIETGEALAQEIPEPSWGGQTLPLPEFPLGPSLLQLDAVERCQPVAPLQFRSVALHPLARYDEVQTPLMEAEFDL